MFCFSCANRKILDLPEESMGGSLAKHFEIESVVPIETDDELLITNIVKVI
jgi:hypothetical protein